MEPRVVATDWYAAFLDTIRKPPLSERLCAAATMGQLADWTRALTDAVVAASACFGWQSAAKGHPAGFMPAVRGRVQQEYLALDVMAFDAGDCRQPAEGFRWPFPVAVFELENKTRVERIAFSLWKVVMARASLRVMFCYSADRERVGRLVRSVAQAVLPALPAPELASLAPGLLVVVGTRDRAENFPYGFFHEWILDGLTGQLRRP